MPPGGGPASVLGSTLLFSLGISAMTGKNSARSSDVLPPLPFDAAIWARVVEELKLSPRLAATAELALRGMQCKDIAKKLCVAEPTVRTYLDRIYQRSEELGAPRRDRTSFILLVFAIVVRLLGK